MRQFVVLLFLLGSSLTGMAQQGTLKGKVKDQKTGEPVIGAVVFITGSSTGTATDYNGDYTLKIDPGLYKITVSFVSYKPTTYNDVKIEPGKSTTLNFEIEESAASLNTVSIVGTRQTNTDMSLINEIRQSEVVVSGVSGEQITKSMDRDAAETVKRIPGVTIMNDKYIVIRGMNERYNSVMLNDALTPSTEPDSRAFSFDVLPTSVIDRILIYKNGSPELPGDFAGGVIKIYSKSFAEQNTTRFNVSTSYRSGVTFNNFLTAPDNNSYFYNPNNSNRDLPSDFPADLKSIGNTDRLAEYGKQLANSWTPMNSQALPDLRMSLGLTRQINAGNVRLSNVTAVTYSNTRQNIYGPRNSYEAQGLGFAYQDDTYSHSMRLGVLHNWTARLNNTNKIVFSNLFNHMAASDVLIRQGTEYFNQVDQMNYALRNESRTLYSGQFQGTHDLNQDKTTVTWTGGYSYTNRNEPDYRRVRTQREINTDEPYAIAFKPTPSLADAGRFFSKLNEHVLTGAGQIEHRFNPADSLRENAPKVRAGFYVEQKNRDFNARFFSYRPANPATFDQNLPLLPVDVAFAPQNINTTTGLAFIEGTNPSDSYTASNTYAAAYVGASSPILDQLSVSGGVRLEYNNQYLESKNQLGRPFIFNDVTLRPLPSVNLTYEFSQRSMLRAGSSISLNRPQFREVAPFSYYNFITLFEEKGAPLRTATIYNADLRYEFYPSPTELLSIGVFGKYFNDPIERYFEDTNMGNSISYTNADRATSYGVEVEARKSLQDLTGSAFLQRFSVLLNASLIQSNVVLPAELSSAQVVNRPMMGQSPYVVNSGLYYEDEKNQLQATLLYNVIGKRIFAVGSYINPTVYEMPRNVLDLSVTKGLGDRFELKAGIQDILNQPFLLMQDTDENAKINAEDDLIQKFRRGSYSTVGLTYKF